MQRKARIAVVVGVVAISFAAIFFKKTDPMHPLVAAGLRLAIAAGCLAPLVIRRWRRLDSGMRWGAMLGGVFYAAHFGTWVTSLTLTSVAASVTLVTATPILLAIYAFATKTDRPSRWQLLAIAIAVVGVATIARESGGAALLGDALAFAGAAAMAGYLLVVRRFGERVDVWAFTGIACAVGAVLLLGAGLVLGVPIVVPSSESALFVLLAALIPQLIGHSALTWAVRVLPPTRVGMATIAEPVGATLLAWIWLGEVAPPLTLLGCSITLFAVLLSFRSE